MASAAVSRSGTHELKTKAAMYMMHASSSKASSDWYARHTRASTNGCAPKYTPNTRAQSSTRLRESSTPLRSAAVVSFSISFVSFALLFWSSLHILWDAIRELIPISATIVSGLPLARSMSVSLDISPTIWSADALSVSRERSALSEIPSESPFSWR